MLKNDLVERMIEQLAQALVHILGLAKAGKLDEAEAENARALERLVGFKPEALLSLGVNALLALAMPGGQLDFQRAAWLGRLLKTHGDLRALQGDAFGAKQAHVQAFCLYDELESRGELGDHKETLAWLVDNLS